MWYEYSEETLNADELKAAVKLLGLKAWVKPGTASKRYYINYNQLLKIGMNIDAWKIFINDRGQLVLGGNEDPDRTADDNLRYFRAHVKEYAVKAAEDEAKEVDRRNAAKAARIAELSKLDRNELAMKLYYLESEIHSEELEDESGMGSKHLAKLQDEADEIKEAMKTAAEPTAEKLAIEELRAAESEQFALAHTDLMDGDDSTMARAEERVRAAEAKLASLHTAIKKTSKLEPVKNVDGEVVPMKMTSHKLSHAQELAFKVRADEDKDALKELWHASSLLTSLYPVLGQLTAKLEYGDDREKSRLFEELDDAAKRLG